MDDLVFSPCCEFTYGGASDHLRSIASQPIILAVDDDEDNLLLLAYALEPLGCGLLTASDGLTALRKAYTYQPNLILLDILMPYMNGMEVAMQLRKDAKMKAVPIIAVTALARMEDRERLLVAGFNDYISKPYMIEEIESLVRHYLPLPVSIS